MHAQFGKPNNTLRLLRKISRPAFLLWKTSEATTLNYFKFVSGIYLCFSPSILTLVFLDFFFHLTNIYKAPTKLLLSLGTLVNTSSIDVNSLPS